MNRDDIHILLENRDIRFRRVAIDEIVMSFPQYADLFFSAFLQSDTQAKEMANAALQWMPFLRDGYDERITPFESPSQYKTFTHLAEAYLIFIQNMRTFLSELDTDIAQQAENRLWYHLPGIRDELGNHVVPPKPEENRQLMVFVTGRCNLHCPYCFSKELQSTSISQTDMMRVLSWAQSQNVQSLLPCGGEPLLYEHMNWLIQEVEQRNMKMYFATNLSVPLPKAMLNAKNIGQLHVHLTDELFRNENTLKTFHDNLRLCLDHNLNIILRGNLYKDIQYNHYEEWFKIAKKYNIHAINIAFTIPSHTGSNRFVRIDSLQTMLPHLEYILDQGRENNIRISFAKPFPLCILPEDMAIDILRHDQNASFCNIGEDGGMHNLSLSTDMRFSPCLGVDFPNVPFKDDLDWSTLRSIMGPTVEELQSTPLLKRCHDCFLYHRRLCQGACLSYKQAKRGGGSICVE